MPHFATTFFSYNSEDKELVHRVADHLMRRGIVTWLDRDDIPLAGNLEHILKTFIKEQGSATVFISHTALQSPWVNLELKQILEHLDDAHILPIYLGDPLALVTSNEALKARWLTENGKVRQNGIVLDVNQTGLEELANNPEKQADYLIDQKEMPKFYFNLLETSRAPAIIFYLKQRGAIDNRSGIPELPNLLQALDDEYNQAIPALVLRVIDHNAVAGHMQTLDGEDWQHIKPIWQEALLQAVDDVRKPRHVYIVGQSQLAMPFFVGRIFDRSTRADLFCVNVAKDGSEECFTNQGQERRIPLNTGNPNCHSHLDYLPNIEANKAYPRLSLALITENYVKTAYDFASEEKYPPFAWIKTSIKSDIFETSEQVMAFVADVVAFLKQHQVKELYLFVSLPFHVLPILAANLKYVVDKITFVEYDPGQRVYVPLSMD